MFVANFCQQFNAFSMQQKAFYFHLYKLAYQNFFNKRVDKFCLNKRNKLRVQEVVSLFIVMIFTYCLLVGV